MDKEFWYGLLGGLVLGFITAFVFTGIYIIMEYIF